MVETYDLEMLERKQETSFLYQANELAKPGFRLLPFSKFMVTVMDRVYATAATLPSLKAHFTRVIVVHLQGLRNVHPRRFLWGSHGRRMTSVVKRGLS